MLGAGGACAPPTGGVGYDTLLDHEVGETALSTGWDSADMAPDVVFKSGSTHEDVRTKA